MFEKLLKKLVRSEVPKEEQLHVFGSSENKSAENIIPVETDSAAIPPEEQLKAEDIMAGKEIDPASDIDNPKEVA